MSLYKRYTEEEEVADIAQEVFVKVYEKWNEFDSLGNAKAFCILQPGIFV